MEIKKKFNVGDKVFAMHNNKAIEFTLQRTIITIEKDKLTEVEYLLKTDDFSMTEESRFIITGNENILFSTKKELIESL